MVRKSEADLRREGATDFMWATIDPLMHRRYEEARERQEADGF
ncbi:MAG: hypothetical protein SVU32_00165 [Candidatus Nanohaloarchaea archaeon]|nr:hypothetical protein [Candidatus Nanohaloarchaea archaeon]